MEKRNVIGENLKFWRKNRGFSQEQFAAKLHLSDLNLDRSAISRIESFNPEVYDYEMVYFCIVLNISLLDLYFDILN